MAHGLLHHAHAHSWIVIFFGTEVIGNLPTWLGGPVALIAAPRFIGNCALEPTLIEQRLQVLPKEMNPVLWASGLL